MGEPGKVEAGLGVTSGCRVPGADSPEGKVAGPLDIRLRLAGLWAGLMALYVYCDIYSLYRPGHLGEMAAGHMGTFTVDQVSLLIAGILMILPALMIPLSLLVAARVSAWISLMMAILYTLVNLGNLAGETWIYYWAFGLAELGITVFLVLLSAGELRKAGRGPGQAGA